MQKRYSRKREAILTAVCSVTSHPSAEWVYQRLKPMYPDLSLGTVYRNLAAFRDEGRVALVGVVDGEERFDGNTTEHPHFVCENCGRVEDVPVAGMPAALSTEAGYQIRRCDVTLWGLCPRCTKPEGQAASGVQ